MKHLIFLVFLILSFTVSAQILEIPTLKSKGIQGQVSSIEWYTYQYVQDKGEIKVKKDIETFDAQGRLTSVLTEDYNNKQSYKTVYTVDKKGVLQKVQVLNPANNLALRTSDYEYKKGLLVKTTQSQGTNSITKNYSYNKSDQLIKVEVLQNGALTFEEYYELDAEGRRTKVSRMLTTDVAPKVISTFTYESTDGFLTIVENRATEQGDFVITKTRDETSNRDISEVTKRVSDGAVGTSRQFFQEDNQGNWIKGEVIGDQDTRSRIVLRKITYANGTTTGREKVAFPEDYHAQYIRQYSQKQVAVNGLPYYTGTAYSLDYTDDRLTYVNDLNSWILLTDYDKIKNRTTWTGGEVLGGGKSEVFWTKSKAGISVFNAGRRFLPGTAKNTYSSYTIGKSYIAYIRGEVNRSFVVRDAAAQAGKLVKAELTTDHFYWGKLTDSTYVLTSRGKVVNLQNQIEDARGNKLAIYKQGAFYYWYFLPDFRAKFDNSQVGSIHSAEQVYEIDTFLRQDKLQVDLSTFAYTKLANMRYRLLSADGLSITNIASKSMKTSDDKLITYFPLTQQYLEMENFYSLENGKEWKNQKVNVISDSTAYIYHLYNDNKSIKFYTPEGSIKKRAFANHRLDPSAKKYGAIVYDSLSNVSYGMNYDLDSGRGFGPMRKLIANTRGAYIIKLENGGWVIIVKGTKVQDYTFSKQSKNGAVVHFFKDEKGKTGAMVFKDFDKAKAGDIQYATLAFKKDIDAYLEEFGIDPELKKSEGDIRPKGKPLTFDKKNSMLYARDIEGNEIASRFTWYGSAGTGKDVYAHDSIGKATYRLYDYFSGEMVLGGKVEKVVGTEDLKALKWNKSNVYLSIGGELRKDVARTWITQNASDKIYKEVFYDKSEGKSYSVSYPSDSSFYLVDIEELPTSHNDAYLFRINEKNFFMVEKGKRTSNSGTRSRVLGDHLVRMIPDGDGVKGYIFRGYKTAKLFDLIPAAAMSDSELESAWAKAGEELKSSAPNLASNSAGKGLKYPEIRRPNNDWTKLIDKCGTDAGCLSNAMNRLGSGYKDMGNTDQQVLTKLVPYFVYISDKSQKLLFDVFMKIDAKYTGVASDKTFPVELKKFIKEESQRMVDEYVKKNGAPKVKTVPYKGKGGGN